MTNKIMTMFIIDIINDKSNNLFNEPFIDKPKK
jgi:hypothetical protein